MRTFQSQTKMACVLMSLAAAVACGRGGTGGSTTVMSEEATINSALGAGLDDPSMAETDEDPEAAMAAAGESDAAADPAVAAEDGPPPAGTEMGAEDTASLDAAEAEAGVNAPTVFYIGLAWGRFPFERNAEPLAVNGSVELSVGGIKVLRRVALEQVRQGDSITRDPQMPLRKLNVDTTIGCCMDGLATKVILHERLNQTGTSTPREATLTLTMEGQEPLVIELNPGVETLDRVVALSNGMRVVVQGFQQKPVAECKQGFLLGRWGRRATTSDGRELGRIAGRYVSEDGTRAGFIRGVFGKRENGQQVFFAKVLGNDGRFLGLLAGTYEGDSFHGEYRVTRNRLSGAVEGRVVVAASGEQGSLGAFRGRWSAHCGEVAGEQ